MRLELPWGRRPRTIWAITGFVGVEPGRYTVGAFFRDDAGVLGLHKRTEPNAAVEGPQTEDYVMTYCPGTRLPAAAAAITLRPGQTTSKIDIQIQIAPSAFIQGSVVNVPDGAGMVQVTLPAEADGLGPHQMFTLQNGAREFLFKSVPEGNYVLRTDIRAGEQMWSARQEVMVAEAPVRNLILQLQPPFTVAGTVTMEEGAPLPSGLKLNLNGIDRRVPYTAALGSTGGFGIPRLLPDKYSLTVADSAGSVYLKSVSLDDQPRDPSAVALERPPGSLQIVLSDKGGRVIGVAVDKDQRPVGRGLVVMVGTAAGTNASWFSSLDAYSEFAIMPVPPGSYRIACFSDIDEAHVTQETLDKVRTRGQELSVEAGKRQTLTLVAVPEDTE